MSAFTCTPHFHTGDSMAHSLSKRTPWDSPKMPTDHKFRYIGNRKLGQGTYTAFIPADRPLLANAEIRQGAKTYCPADIQWAPSQNRQRLIFKGAVPDGAATLVCAYRDGGEDVFQIRDLNGDQNTEATPYKGAAPSPVQPAPTPNEPLFRVTGSSLVFSAKAAPYIEQVFVVAKVNSKGQAGGLDRCQKVNAVTWAASAPLSQYTQPAFYAVDVVDRIEHLIPHSVRGWVYVNGKGEIVQFGAQPLPPPMPPVPPTPQPTPAPEPSKGIAAIFAGVKYADIVEYGIRPVTQPERIDFFTKNASAPEGLRKVGKLTRSADGTWKTPRPVSTDADIFELISSANPKTRPFYSNGNLQIWANGSFRVPGSSRPANK